MINKENYFQSIQELVSIGSVSQPGYPDSSTPYGPGTAKALDYVLNLCHSFGFATKNCDNHCGFAEIGSGPKIFAILSHLDTVPVGDGWDYSQGEIANGNLYGRGVSDDKGPTIACIYALKEIMDSGISLPFRIRMIFGLAEETGNWTDLDYYKKTEESPTLGFTPDADFPVIYAEKGIYVMHLILPDSSHTFEALNGGNAINVVPNQCSATIRMKNGQTVPLDFRGKSAHGSMPENGINAISLLMEYLYSLQREGKIDCPSVNFYHQLFSETGLNKQYESQLSSDSILQDESGHLTVNPGTISLKEGNIILGLDFRYPVTANADFLISKIRKTVADFSGVLKIQNHMKPVYLSTNTPLVQTLLDAYRSETGDNTSPSAIGGGTYARAFSNIVAFGPVFPGRELTEHQKNEHLAVSDLWKLTAIYQKALQSFCTQTI